MYTKYQQDIPVFSEQHSFNFGSVLGGSSHKQKKTIWKGSHNRSWGTYDHHGY